MASHEKPQRTERIPRKRGSRVWVFAVGGTSAEQDIACADIVSSYNCTYCRREALNALFEQIVSLMKDPLVIPGRGNNDSDGSTSSGLLDRVQTHTLGAWERLTTLYGPWVYSWARRLGLRAEDAAEVVQEVFLGDEGTAGAG